MRSYFFAKCTACHFIQRTEYWGELVKWIQDHRTLFQQGFTSHEACVRAEMKTTYGWMPETHYQRVL